MSKLPLFQISLFLFFGIFGCAPEKKDFFECGSINELVACPVGESPDPAIYGDCRAVGDGETTLPDGDCV